MVVDGGEVGPTWEWPSVTVTLGYPGTGWYISLLLLLSIVRNLRMTQSWEVYTKTHVGVLSEYSVIIIKTECLLHWFWIYLINYSSSDVSIIQTDRRLRHSDWWYETTKTSNQTYFSYSIRFMRGLPETVVPWPTESGRTWIVREDKVSLRSRFRILP